MAVSKFVPGVLALLAFTTVTCQTSPAGNDKLEDTVAKLAERLNKLSEQMEQLVQTSDKQTKQYDQLSSKVQQYAGPTFVRWGKKSCNGTNSKLVYSGVAAGSSSLNIGGTSNIHCLPRNPNFGNHDEARHSGHTLVVAEYKFLSLDNFPFDKAEPLLDNDVPCAVCEVTNGSSVMMIPGRADCYTDWRMVYRGYLMGEAYDVHRTDDVCVDENPEVDYNGEERASHSVGLYPVESWCGGSSMPCPPYGHRWEIACVVCSK